MVGSDGHASDEDLERYSLGNVNGEDSARLEEHLLICESCRARLEEHDLIAGSMASAAARWREEHPRPNTGGRPLVQWLLAIAAVLALGLGAAWLGRPGADRNAPPIAIALSTTRGAAPGAHAPARRPLELSPDLTGIAALPQYDLEVVDRVGGKVARMKFAPGAPARIPALQPGTYFVRLYSPAGELLREYALSVSD